MRKQYLKKLFPFILILVTGIYLSSCKDKKDASVPTPVTVSSSDSSGTLILHLENYEDGQYIGNFVDKYATSSGRFITYKVIEQYLSNFQLVKTDGSIYSIPDTIILKTQANENYNLGNIPIGNYKSIRFHVGLDAATNLKSSSASGNVLNKSEMWFGTSAQPQGYIFLNVQGTVDTANVPGEFNKLIPFTYKIGTNASYTSITLPDHNFTIKKNVADTIALNIDLYRLFDGIELNKKENLSVASTADNMGTVAAKIRNNIPLMFSYK